MKKSIKPKEYFEMLLIESIKNIGLLKIKKHIKYLQKIKEIDKMQAKRIRDKALFLSKKEPILKISE